MATGERLNMVAFCTAATTKRQPPPVFHPGETGSESVVTDQTAWAWNQRAMAKISVTALHAKNSRQLRLRSANPPISSTTGRDRKRLVWGKSVSVRRDFGGRRFIKKK